MALDLSAFPTGYGTSAPLAGAPASAQSSIVPSDYQTVPGSVANMVRALQDGYGKYLQRNPSGMPATPAPGAPGAPMDVRPPAQAQNWPPAGAGVPFAGVGGGGMGLMDMMKGSGMPTGGLMDFLKPKPKDPMSNALFSPVPTASDSQNAIY